MFLYECMYLRMYVCTVCMYVRMYVCTVCMYVRVYVCMYVLHMLKICFRIPIRSSWTATWGKERWCWR